MVGGESRESECLRIFDEGLFTNPVGTRKCTDTGRTGKKDHILFFEKEKESDALLRSGSFNSGVINCDIEQIQLTKSTQKIQEQDGSVLKIDSVMGVQYDSLSTKRAEKPIYNKIVVPRGGEYFVTLSEGTKVWLDADSELEYPVFFSGDFREVKLKGNAYFCVTKKNDKPFVVRAGEFSLKVYGTEFNVNAYDLQNIETVLVNGSIGFKANVSTPERMMAPNELAVSDSRTGLSEIHQVDIYPYIAWKNQNIVFVNERLESIMEKMARWYDVTVFFQDESLKDLRFDCNMRRYTDIRDLFFFLEKTSNARFALNGRTVVISKK